MTPDLAAEIFGRLCFTGPLLYLGLQMVFDPEGFIAASRKLAVLIQALEETLRSGTPPAWGDASEAAPLSPRMRSTVRLAGAALSLCAFLPFTIVN